MAEVSTPYSSAQRLLGAALPSWLNVQDAARLGSYKLYEDIYWTVEDTFKLIWRGTPEEPIYIPTGRIICNTMARYVGRGWGFQVDPMFGSSSEQQLAQQIFADLWARERIIPQFKSNVLYTTVRGDGCWYITADPNKPEGSRITIRTLDPGSYFRIEDETDQEKLLGCDIIEQIVTPDNKLTIKRQRYLKSEHPDHIEQTGLPGGDISFQVDTFELENWEDPEKAKVYNQGINIPAIVVTGITHLPVYHIKNFEEPGNPWGSSEMRGIERIIGALSQTLSDQDLAIALAGLGVYATDASTPTDEEGNELPWYIAPGRVIEHGAGRKFERVSGITTVQPPIDHMNFMQDQVFRIQGAGDVAQGRVDVTVAESGIALRLRMGPLLDAASDKDDLLLATMNQMLFDLREWIRVYENQNIDNVRVTSHLGDKIPTNKQEKFNLLMSGYQADPPLWSGRYVREEMRKEGMDLPDELTNMKDITSERQAYADLVDPEGARLQQEAEGDEEEPPVEEE